MVFNLNDDVKDDSDLDEMIEEELALLLLDKSEKKYKFFTFLSWYKSKSFNFMNHPHQIR